MNPHEIRNFADSLGVLAPIGEILSGIPYGTGTSTRKAKKLRPRRACLLLATNLSRAGISPKSAQLLARHSDINLTMNTYTMLGVLDQAAAVEGLPAIPEVPGIPPVPLRNRKWLERLRSA